MTETRSEYQPILLRPNISYPTYQLYAVAGRAGQEDAALKMVILETMQWLRQRFRAFDLPAELAAPAPDRYQELDLGTLESFHLDLGYRLEVIWLAEQNIWVMQLAEPDFGVGPGAISPERPPVPGRFFETNVAYRKTHEGVVCGFQTVVHEPPETAVPCEVFRLAFIKLLARNQSLGLRQGWPIIDQAHVLKNRAEIKNLKNWLTAAERMLPVVILTEQKASRPKVSIFDLPRTLPTSRRPDFPIPPELQTEEKRKEAAPVLPIPVVDLARYRMGYAQFFVLPEALRSVFTEMTGREVNGGDVWVEEPSAFGGGIRTFSSAQCRDNPQKVCAEMDEFVQNYPRGKKMQFGDCVFLFEAKEMQRDQTIRLHRSVAETVDLYEAKLAANKVQTQREVQKLKEAMEEKEAKIQRLNQAVEEEERQKERVQKTGAEQVQAMERTLAVRDRTIAWHQNRKDRPEKLEEVPVWVERRFAGKLIFHSRAVDMCEKISPDKVNLPLVCDALEYLAEEYRDHLTGQISTSQRDELCSAHYHRPFEVVLDRGPSVESYPGDYKIKYYPGHKGKPIESVLDLHLKVGNDADNLLRIYFLYDKEKQLMVVGSLPEHLRTVSFK